LNYDYRRAIGENETGFRGQQDVLYRTEGWEFLIAGGALYNNLDYSFTTKHPAGDFLDYTSPGGGSPALREQLAILKRFLESFDFVRMAPDQSTVKSASDDVATRVLSQPGRQYAIYLHSPLPKKLEKKRDEPHRPGMQTTLELNLPPGDYHAEWINTKTGQTDGAETFSHSGGVKRLTSPKFDDDGALRITAK
jgi:hypothetical protein